MKLSVIILAVCGVLVECQDSPWQHKYPLLSVLGIQRENTAALISSAGIGYLFKRPDALRRTQAQYPFWNIYTQPVTDAQSKRLSDDTTTLNAKYFRSSGQVLRPSPEVAIFGLNSTPKEHVSSSTPYDQTNQETAAEAKIHGSPHFHDSADNYFESDMDSVDMLPTRDSLNPKADTPDLAALNYLTNPSISPDSDSSISSSFLDVLNGFVSLIGRLPLQYSSMLTSVFTEILKALSSIAQALSDTSGIAQETSTAKSLSLRSSLGSLEDVSLPESESIPHNFLPPSVYYLPSDEEEEIVYPHYSSSAGDYKIVNILTGIKDLIKYIKTTISHKIIAKKWEKIHFIKAFGVSKLKKISSFFKSIILALKKIPLFFLKLIAAKKVYFLKSKFSFAKHLYKKPKPLLGIIFPYLTARYTLQPINLGSSYIRSGFPHFASHITKPFPFTTPTVQGLWTTPYRQPTETYVSVPKIPHEFSSGIYESFSGTSVASPEVHGSQSESYGPQSEAHISPAQEYGPPPELYGLPPGNNKFLTQPQSPPSQTHELPLEENASLSQSHLIPAQAYPSLQSPLTGAYSLPQPPKVPTVDSYGYPTAPYETPSSQATSYGSLELRKSSYDEQFSRPSSVDRNVFGEGYLRMIGSPENEQQLSYYQPSHEDGLSEKHDQHTSPLENSHVFTSLHLQEPRKHRSQMNTEALSQPGEKGTLPLLTPSDSTQPSSGAAIPSLLTSQDYVGNGPRSNHTEHASNEEIEGSQARGNS